ncbi:protein jag [Terrabacter sp. 2TAF16]|jgi:spoIIIJ-associated protein|uniref:Jag family protein n=1 Tax=Terrabacter sp. 2TAF16 TaxID=3233008 RepID=UPI003F9A38C0
MSDTQAADVETPADATAEPVTGEATSEATSDTPEQLTEVPEPTLSVEASQNDEVAETASPAETPGATADSDEPDVEDQGNKADKGDKKSRVRMLEREGEVAADFLETLLDIADLDGDIDVDVDGDRAAIAIVDSDEGRVPRRLVGTDGKVLEALQELTRLAVQVETGERSRLMLDIAGHRAQRRSALVELAKVAIAEVQESGTKRALEPMTAFERKVVHDEVAAAGLVSESEGVDPHRHIVILPA